MIPNQMQKRNLNNILAQKVMTCNLLPVLGNFDTLESYTQQTTLLYKQPP